MRTLKIFEQREYTDGGITDRGSHMGWIQADSEDQIRKRLDIKHGFIQFRETPIQEFLNRIGVLHIDNIKQVIGEDKELETLETVMDIITGKNQPVSKEDPLFKNVESMINKLKK